MPPDQDILKTSAELDYGIEFPLSIYERPMYAMSNLLLRGDVDAATRAIFQPDTLSPVEMQSFTRRIAGPNPNKLTKTILDVATNPLVIAGLIGGYLLYPAVGAGTLAKIFTSTRKGIPETGLLGKFVGGAFTRLRHLVTHTGESMHGTIADINSAILKHVDADQTLRAAAHGTIAPGRPQHQVAMGLQGWHKGMDSDLKHIFKLADRPIAPGFQGKMQEGVQSAIAKTDKYLKKVWSDLERLPGFKKKFEAEAKRRGLTVGKMRENFFPHQARENKLRQAVLKHAPGGSAGASDDIPNTIANSLLRRKGVNVPDPAQLRAGEAAGDIVAGFADDVERGIKANISEFRGNLVKEMAKNGPSEGGVRKAVETVTARMDIDKRFVTAAVDRINSASQGIGGQSLDSALDWASEMIRRPGTYSLDLDDVLTRYSTQIARAKAWFGTPSNMPGKSLGEKYNHLVDYFRHTIRPDGKDVFMPVGSSTDNYLTKQLIPMNMGQKSAKAVARNSAWMEWRLKRADFLKSPMVKKMIPDKPRKWMINQLEDLSNLDADTVGHGINSYLYMSSMGMNLGPASKNVFQNPLTFINLPGMGPGAWAHGLKETFTRSMAYLGDAKALGSTKSFSKHFGDFVESQGPQSGLIEKLFGGQEIVGMPATGIRKGVDTFRDVLMAPFKFSELFVNRMPAFYGARGRAVAWNVGKDAAKGLTGKAAAEASRRAVNRVASNIVDASHFTGGPMGMPAGIMDTWAPWRQFMQFPMRTMDFMINSTRMGKDASKLDFGTISRMTAAAAGTYTVGKDLLGVDLSPGLLAGALPLPQYENAPFYPFPLVSPLVQMAGNVVKGVATGDAQPFQDIAPLLVPGGLAAKRLAKTLGPKRADYERRMDDGRVPVYNDRNGLIGAYSPLQLGLRAVGIMPMEAAAERGAAQWLVGQRDRIREYRQRWLEAQTENDPIKAEKVQMEFQKQYPELNRMEFRKSDINSIEQRRNTARISRIMRGVSKVHKPLFQNIIDEAQLGASVQGLPQEPLPIGLRALQ